MSRLTNLQRNDDRPVVYHVIQVVAFSENNNTQ